MNEADFSIDGDSIPGSGDLGFDATLSQTLALTLRSNPSRALSVLYEIYDPAESGSPLASAGADELVFSPSGISKQLLVDVNASAGLTMPATGFHSYIVRCTTSHPEGPQFFERMIVIRSAVANIRKTIPGEAAQYRQRGPSDELNEYAEAIESGGGGGGGGATTPFETTFTSTSATATLSWSGSVLTIIHTLGTLNPVVTVRRPDGVREPMAVDTTIDADTISIDFSGFGVSSTPWSIRVSSN